MNRRRFVESNVSTLTFSGLLGSAFQAFGLGPSQADRQETAATSGLGINLTGFKDWNREHPFVDPFQMARAWISQAEGKRFGQGPPLELDANGWVRRLEPGCWAEKLLYTNQKDHIPEGRYRIDFEKGGGSKLA